MYPADLKLVARSPVSVAELVFRRRMPYSYQPVIKKVIFAHFDTKRWSLIQTEAVQTIKCILRMNSFQKGQLHDDRCETDETQYVRRQLAARRKLIRSDQRMISAVCSHHQSGLKSLENPAPHLQLLPRCCNYSHPLPLVCVNNFSNACAEIALCSECAITT